MAIDFTSEFGKRALRHLENDQVAWLTTVTAGGAPQPSPIWFHWDGGAIVIHSQPNAPKVRAIRQNPQVTVHFNSTSNGDDVVIFTGTAALLNEGQVSATSPAYDEKYAGGYRSLSLTPESFVGEYSQLIRIEPSRLRGF